MTTIQQLDIFMVAPPAVEIAGPVYGRNCTPFHLWRKDNTWGQWVAVCDDEIRAYTLRDRTDKRPDSVCAECERRDGEGR